MTYVNIISNKYFVQMYSYLYVIGSNVCFYHVECLEHLVKHYTNKTLLVLL